MAQVWHPPRVAVKGKTTNAMPWHTGADAAATAAHAWGRDGTWTRKNFRLQSSLRGHTSSFLDPGALFWYACAAPAHTGERVRAVALLAGCGDRSGAASAERRRDASRRPALLGELGSHVLADHGACRAPRGRVPQRAVRQRRGRRGRGASAAPPRSEPSFVSPPPGRGVGASRVRLVAHKRPACIPPTRRRRDAQRTDH